MIKSLASAIGLFSIAWLIVGSVWLFTDDDCHDHFYSMWALMLSILIISYIACGLMLLLCCCICICGAGMGIGAALKLKLRRGD